MAAWVRCRCHSAANSARSSTPGGASFDNRFLGTGAGHLFCAILAKALVVWIRSTIPDREEAVGRHIGRRISSTTLAYVCLCDEAYDALHAFYGIISGRYYLQDNFKNFCRPPLSLRQACAGNVGGEYGMPLGHGVMAALFAEAPHRRRRLPRHRGGLRFYFGQKDKTLIRRHREDDPSDWSDGFGISNGGSTARRRRATCSPAATADAVKGRGYWSDLPAGKGGIYRTDGAGPNVIKNKGPRCIALVGPFQSGKTTLLEAILARTEAVQRQGTVDAGTTVGDASKEARNHKMSVEASVATTTFMAIAILSSIARIGRIHP